MGYCHSQRIWPYIENPEPFFLCSVNGVCKSRAEGVLYRKATRSRFDDGEKCEKDKEEVLSQHIVVVDLRDFPAEMLKIGNVLQRLVGKGKV